MNPSASANDETGVKRQRRETPPKDQQQYPRTSLMGLPPELRLEILKHVGPNRKFMPNRSSLINEWDQSAVEDFRGRLKDEADIAVQESVLVEFHWEYIPTRTDFESSTPAIFRVNQTLYQETAHLIYFNTMFEATVYDRGIQFHGVRYYFETRAIPDHDSSARLAAALKPVNSLFLDIAPVKWVSTEEEFFGPLLDDSPERSFPNDQHRRLKGTLYHLVEVLSSSTCLRQLHIRFLNVDYTPSSKDDAVVQLKEAVKGVRWLAQAFDGLRRLVDVRFILDDATCFADTCVVTVQDLLKFPLPSCERYGPILEGDQRRSIFANAHSPGTQSQDTSDYAASFRDLCSAMCSAGAARKPPMRLFQTYERLTKAVLCFTEAYAVLGIDMSDDHGETRQKLIDAWHWMDEGKVDELSGACKALVAREDTFKFLMERAVEKLDLDIEELANA